MQDTRTRMVRGAAQMIAERGVEAMSLRELADQAQVPIGSMYHHFPGGKSELVDEAVGSVGSRISRLLEEAREHGHEQALDRFAELWRRVLRDSDFAAGCPVLAAATARDPRHHAVAHGVFAEWHDNLAAVLEDAGVDHDRAPGLARLVVTAMEGAVGLARASRTTQPLDEVVAELRIAVRHALDER